MLCLEHAARSSNRNMMLAYIGCDTVPWLGYLLFGPFFSIQSPCTFPETARLTAIPASQQSPFLQKLFHAKEYSCFRFVPSLLQHFFEPLRRRIQPAAMRQGRLKFRILWILTIMSRVKTGCLERRRRMRSSAAPCGVAWYGQLCFMQTASNMQTAIGKC